MKVIVTEKPSVARDIARVLKIPNKGDGFFHGNGYRVTWALGHLVGLVDPDGYGEQFKQWQLETLPIIPESFKTQVIDRGGSAAQFNVIKTLLVGEGVTEVICATDAGREGELIFRHIYTQAGCDAPIKRLWISSQTDKAIKDGFAALEDGKAYEPLYDSALCRSEADWLVGMNATRAYTVSLSRGDGVMSVGRVQTPVLKMIVDRHREHVEFKPEIFYEITTTIQHPNGSFEGRWINSEKDTRLKSKEDADLVLGDLQKHADGTIGTLTQKQKKENQPLLYDLTELQKDANKRFKHSADQTLKIMQELYEKHKILTYPRTSSRYLSQDMVPKLGGLLDNVAAVETFAGTVAEIKSKDLAITKRIVDDKKVTDHHAIIPTDKTPDVSVLSPEELNIYDMVIRRFLAVFLPECLKDQTEIITKIGDHQLRSFGTIMTRPGWRSVYLGVEDAKKAKGKKAAQPDDVVLPNVSEGDAITHGDPTQHEGKTKAPALYNEASILGAMETAGKQIEDEGLREAMKDCGLGTPATRAQILERLISVGYVTRDKNRFTPTEKGIYLISSIKDEALMSAELTGDWEKKLNDMAKGEFVRQTYMDEIVGFTKSIIAQVTADRVAFGDCPSCGGAIQESRMAYGCSNWKERGCEFKIWKSVASKVISPKQAQQLLTKGKTDVIKGFKSKAGKSFDASLSLENGKVVFAFSRDVMGSCPLCQGDVVETPKSYGCANWKISGCTFTIWKEIAKKKLGPKEVKALLKDKQTEVLSGFTSRAGKPFDAKLVVAASGKVEFLF